MSDRPDLDLLVQKALLDLLSDRIVERLRIRARSALVLLSGTDLGLRGATASMAQLAARGWRLEIWRSTCAGGLIGAEQLRGLAGGVEPLVPSDAALSPEEIEACLMRHALVLVPALSLPLAARVAGGLADSALPGLLSGALERGKRVIAARDGCCPANRERLARGLGGTPAYQSMLAGQLERLEAFGVEFVWASRLAEAVSGSAMPAPVVPSTPVERAERRVFGWNEAKTVASDTLRLARNVLVTPLAAEELRARSVQLVRE
ncbi:hypothetical protein CLV78_11510 [Aliiruegeria haliotis]|uniref:Flavoprotein n=1 Tax=Aliiruegeria haliotis TaxID=1280846 RepID=A0A2T0RG11_9RHOB|nr:hypothetical protein [Aliiruegeria haliotis]PRY20061.1 hypothetical protein CLV78_11510 [Aliiruegeria haliotis]